MSTFDDNWERARGVVCPRCHQETLRTIPVKEGRVCPHCAQEEWVAYDKQRANLGYFLEHPKLARRAQRYLKRLSL